MSVQRFRKKPVVIEAMQFTEMTGHQVAQWANASIGTTDGVPRELLISTLEGVMVANVGNWIIRGVQGEFYPCKPDIFEATYEAVSS